MVLPSSGAIITFTPEQRVGSPAPEGYLDWHEWAEVQHKAGLRQVECSRCARWCYPQETVFVPEPARGVFDRRLRPIEMLLWCCHRCAHRAPGAAEAGR